MKKSTLYLYTIVFGLFLQSTANAVTFEFTGTVESIRDESGQIAGNISVGDAFSGRLTYDADTVDQDPDAGDGDYEGAVQEWVVNVGGQTFELADPSQTFIFIEDRSTTGGRDLYQIFTGSIGSSFSTASWRANWFFTNPNGQAFNDDSLPLSGPDLSLFTDGTQQIFVNDLSTATAVFLDFTSITQVPDVNEDFSIAIIPDTQTYVENHPEVFEAQIQWIIDNAGPDDENIVYVAHLGDLKDSRICDDLVVSNGSGNDRTEWQIVDNAFDRLDAAGIPYGVVPGNHDFDSMFVDAGGNPLPASDPERCPTWDSVFERPLSIYNSADNFAPSRFASTSFYGDPLGLNNSLGQVEPGNRVPGSNEDNFTLFEGTCGLKFVAVNLAYKEGANAVSAALGGGAEIDWADELLKLYPDRLGIVTSHHFLEQNSDIGDGGAPGSFGGDYGADVYNGLTDPGKGDNPNLIMMLSAHERGEAWRGFPTNPPDNDNQGAFRRAGLQPLHAILSDYQSVLYPDDPTNVDFGKTDGDPSNDLDGDRGNTGDGGFMRIMRFDTSAQMINVETFAPAVSFLDAGGNPYSYDHRPDAPDERTTVLQSDYFPANGTGMDKDTASNFSFSFAGYGAASAANTCVAP